MTKIPTLIIALLLTASPLVLTLPWNQWLSHSQWLREGVAGLGNWSPVLFILSTCLGTALGLPRLVFCVAAGWLFGFGLGFAWSQLGSLLGAYGLFLIARRSRPETLLKKYPRLGELSKPMGDGWLSVLLVRQLPLAGLYNDILLAWSQVSHRDFWIGSFIGFLPLGITATLAGAGAIQANPSQIGGYLAEATLLFVILSLMLKKMIQRKSGYLRADPV